MTNVKDRDDVGMVEGGYGLLFLFEAPKTIAVASKGFWKDLQSDIAAKPGVAGPVHLAHAAGTNL